MPRRGLGFIFIRTLLVLKISLPVCHCPRAPDAVAGALLEDGSAFFSSSRPFCDGPCEAKFRHQGAESSSNVPQYFPSWDFAYQPIGHVPHHQTPVASGTISEECLIDTSDTVEASPEKSLGKRRIHREYQNAYPSKRASLADAHAKLQTRGALDPSEGTQGETVQLCTDALDEEKNSKSSDVSWLLGTGSTRTLDLLSGFGQAKAPNEHSISPAVIVASHTLDPLEPCRDLSPLTHCQQSAGIEFNPQNTGLDVALRASHVFPLTPADRLKSMHQSLEEDNLLVHDLPSLKTSGSSDCPEEVPPGVTVQPSSDTFNKKVSPQTSHDLCELSGTPSNRNLDLLSQFLAMKAPNELSSSPAAIVSSHSPPPIFEPHAGNTLALPSQHRAAFEVGCPASVPAGDLWPQGRSVLTAQSRDEPREMGLEPSHPDSLPRPEIQPTLVQRRSRAPRRKTNAYPPPVPKVGPIPATPLAQSKPLRATRKRPIRSSPSKKKVAEQSNGLVRARQEHDETGSPSLQSVEPSKLTPRKQVKINISWAALPNSNQFQRKRNYRSFVTEVLGEPYLRQHTFEYFMGTVLGTLIANENTHFAVSWSLNHSNLWKPYSKLTQNPLESLVELEHRKLGELMPVLVVYGQRVRPVMIDRFRGINREIHDEAITFFTIMDMATLKLQELGLMNPIDQFFQVGQHLPQNIDEVDNKRNVAHMATTIFLYRLSLLQRIRSTWDNEAMPGSSEEIVKAWIHLREFWIHYYQSGVPVNSLESDAQRLVPGQNPFLFNYRRGYERIQKWNYVKKHFSYKGMRWSRWLLAAWFIPKLAANSEWNNLLIMDTNMRELIKLTDDAALFDWWNHPISTQKTKNIKYHLN